MELYLARLEVLYFLTEVNHWTTRGAGFRQCIPVAVCLTACFGTLSYLFLINKD